MKILTQLAVLLLICFVGEGIALLLPIPFPASVISMVLLFLLLCTGALKLRQIEDAAEFLTKNMAFFFIPAGVEILENYKPVADKILPLLAAEEVPAMGFSYALQKLWELLTCPPQLW